LSQLKEPRLADGSDMIRHSELTVNQNALMQQTEQNVSEDSKTKANTLK